MNDMRNKIRSRLVPQVLKIFAALSRIVQFGNPHGRAPVLVPAPDDKDTVGKFEGGKVYLFHEALVSGRRGGLLVSNRNQFFANLTHYPSGSHLHPDAVNLKMPSPTKLNGTGAYLCTPQAAGNYYHWMIDLVPRLWLLEQAGYTARNLDYLFVNGQNLSWEKEPLLAHGFRAEQICVCTKSNRFQIERLAAPDMIANYSACEPWKVRFLQRLFAPEPSSQRRQLFCGRKSASWRRLTNEDELYARLEPLGFANINPSGMSVGEQARLFSSASLVVGVHGAMLTNSVFLPEDAFVIEIQSRDSPQNFYTNIYAAKKIRWSLIQAEAVRQATNDFDSNRVDFRLSSGQIDKIISLIEENSASRFTSSQ
ncbi:MAG TPA: glycosyltransferase family 61 protein [Candidatus Methylacidiphilales bacterium]|nr:glycosyltransferase family 61 protein [Candidatus Methylacidiphilales bacterium]